MNNDKDAIVTNPALVVCHASQLDTATAALATIQSALDTLTPQERARVIRYILDAEATRKPGDQAPTPPGFRFSLFDAKVDDLV